MLLNPFKERMFGDRIFSFLVFSLIGAGVTFGSPDISFAVARAPQNSTAIAQAQETPSENPSEAANQLKLGDEGDIVTELQDQLKRLGHYEGSSTGKYDEKTQEAVAKFQTSQQLEPTGIFDTATFEKLREVQRQQRYQNRPWGWKRKLVFFGGGGFILLIGMGGAIFFLLRYINKSGSEPDLQEMDELESGEEEIKLTELYPISKPTTKVEPPAKKVEALTRKVESPARKVEPIVKADELPREEESDDRDPETFPPSFLAPPSSDVPNTWHESPSPSLRKNSTLAPEVPTRDRPNLTQSLASEVPLNYPHLIKSQLDPIEEFIRQLHSPDPDKRKEAIWELAQRADSRAVQPLVSLLLESDSQQQSLILEALSQIGTRTLKPMNRALALSLQDDNAQVRKNAIRDLTRVYELIAQLSQLIYYATDDPDPEVQETAKWALGQLSHIRMLPSDRNHE